MPATTALECPGCQCALVLCMPVHRTNTCVFAHTGRCQNDDACVSDGHALLELCWQCPRCLGAACATGAHACARVNACNVTRADLEAAGIGKNKIPGAPERISCTEFEAHVWDRTLCAWLDCAGAAQILAALVCAYPDTIRMISSERFKHREKTAAGACGTKQECLCACTTADIMCTQTDMEATLYEAAVASNLQCNGYPVGIKAAVQMVKLMCPGEEYFVTHEMYNKFVSEETSSISTASRWCKVCTLARLSRCACTTSRSRERGRA